MYILISRLWDQIFLHVFARTFFFLQIGPVLNFKLEINKINTNRIVTMGQKYGTKR